MPLRPASRPSIMPTSSAAETMRLMQDKNIFAVPTFTISEYFAAHASSTRSSGAIAADSRIARRNFREQLHAGVPLAVGSDVGPSRTARKLREYVLMVKYGMTPAAVLQAGLLNGANCWAGGFRSAS